MEINPGGAFCATPGAHFGSCEEYSGRSPMHELSIAVNIVEIAEEEAARNNAIRVQAVRLRLGSLAGVAKEALRFSYAIACEGTSLEGSQLLIDDSEGTDLEVVALEIE
jgi:hydrogenase/urease nickel incorporation metallochaperone HypA